MLDVREGSERMTPYGHEKWLPCEKHTVRGRDDVRAWNTTSSLGGERTQWETCWPARRRAVHMDAWLAVRNRRAQPPSLEDTRGNYHSSLRVANR